MNKRILLAAVAITVVGIGVRLSAQEFAPPSLHGRYQLLRVNDNCLYLIDTATGHVWARYLTEGDWRDEGNPTQPKPSEPPPKMKKGKGKFKVDDVQRKSERPQATLEIKDQPLNMVIVQREERAVPGSNGTVFIRVGDITDGQAFLTIVDVDRKELFGRKSIRQGDTVEFAVGPKKFTVKVEELRNILIGDDFARLTVCETGRTYHAEKKESNDTAKTKK